MKQRRKDGRRGRILFFLLLAICLYSAARLAHYALSTLAARQTNRELQAIWAEESPLPATAAPAAAPTQSPAETAEPELLEAYQYIGGEMLPAAQTLLEKNPDTVAWLYIPDGVVNLPVVYRDNSYYLNHDFYGAESDSGALFLDENHPLLEDSQYLVIHGHNWYDGSMFGQLAHYRYRGYMEAHPTVYLSTLYRKEEYEVIGVLNVSTDPGSEGYVPYIGLRKFQSTEQFYSFAAIIQENALYWKEGAEMCPDDALLALSTCDADERVVVMCRRVAE